MRFKWRQDFKPIKKKLAEEIKEKENNKKKSEEELEKLKGE